MDGLLLDTERICWECFIDACKPYGYFPDFNIYRDCIGRKVEEGDKILAEGFRDFIPYNSVKPEWNRLYLERIENGCIPLKPGVKNFLEKLSCLNKKKGVATSTEFNTALKKLTKTRIIDYFDVIITGDSVSKSKPDPEIYLKAAEKLGYSPEECIAFEDSDNGVRSAHAAGIKVIQITDMFCPSDDVVSLGHQIAGSFLEIELK
jgi:HAD superfamily hydrolase (TIGR01509 family)